MWKNWLFATVFVVLGFGAQAQLNVQFVDPQGEAIEGVILISYLGQEYGPSNDRGFIYDLAREIGSTVQIFKEGYYIKVWQIDWENSSQNTVQLVLQPNDIALEEITVTAEKVPFTDTLRVADFDFQDTLMLVLGYDFLVLAGLDLEPYWSIRNNNDYQTIERDVRGNLFLLSADSATQVVLRGEFVFLYPPVAREQYQTYIEPLAAEIGDALVLRNNRQEQMPLPVSEMRPGNQGKSLSFPPFHNQGVQFFIYRKGEEPVQFYFSVDTAAVLLAHDAFMDVFNIAAGMEATYDKFGVWQHEKLFDLDQAQKIYSMYYAKPLPMPIFNYRGQSWLFDRFTDEVVIFNSMAEEVDRFTLVIDDDFKSPLIIQDYRSGELFALKEKRGMVFIHPIENRRIRTGRKVGLFAKETKLWQGKVFYIDEYKFLQTRASL